MNSLELLFTSITFLASTQKSIINSHNFAWIGVTFPTAARKLTDYQNIDLTITKMARLYNLKEEPSAP